MILVTNKKYEVGITHTPKRLWAENNTEIPPQPLFILREATKEEYNDEHGEMHNPPEFRYYYEVSTD